MAKADVIAAAKDQFAADQAAALDKALDTVYAGAVADAPQAGAPADADEQAKIDAAVAAATGPLNDQIAQLKAAASGAAPVDTTPFSQSDIDAAVAKVTDADAAEMKDLKDKLTLDDQKLADVKASFKKQIQAVIDSLSSDQSQDQAPAAEAPAAQ